MTPGAWLRQRGRGNKMRLSEGCSGMVDTVRFALLQGRSYKMVKVITAFFDFRIFYGYLVISVLVYVLCGYGSCKELR